MWQDWPQSCKLQELFCCCLWCLLLQRSAPLTLTRWWTWSSKLLVMSSMRLRRPTCKANLWCVLVDGWQRSPTCASKTKEPHHSLLAASTSCDIWNGWKFRDTPWTPSPSRSATNLFVLVVMLMDMPAGWLSCPCTSPTFQVECSASSCSEPPQCCLDAQFSNNLVL